MSLPFQIQLSLCDRSELLARNRNPLSSHRAHQCPLGLTCATELFTSSVTGYCPPVPPKSTELGTSLAPRSPRPAPPVVRQGSVRRIDGVCVLEGLPLGLCASTIAHELGHVHLHLDGFSTSLTPPVAEGICELFAYLWLTEGERAAATARPADSDGDERRARVQAMLASSDRVYGKGFRDALAAYYALDSSLPRLLDQVKRRGALPATTHGKELPAAGSPSRRAAKPEAAKPEVAKPAPTRRPAAPAAAAAAASPGGTGFSRAVAR